MGGSAHDIPAPGLGPGVDASVTAVGGQAAWRVQPDRLVGGDLLAGRYQIEALIGIGASGRVLRAFDRETRAVVAVKILKPELACDSSWLDRLARELRVGRQIQHPHVCRVFDIGEADGYRFLTMEIATGGTMATELRAREGLPSLEVRIADARAIVEGVAAFHAAGIIHRDIKPDNILRMADGRLVVSDFGLATDPGVGPTSTIMVGTPAYMAPEIVMGAAGTMRSDVWAIGVVLHEVLFGGRPQWKTSERGDRKTLVVDARVDPREGQLAELCVDCVSDAPGARPASAGEVLRRFEATLAGTGRPRWLLKGVGRGRRHQPFWAGVTLVSFALLFASRSAWRSRAIASLAGQPGTHRIAAFTPGGTSADWSRGASTLASFGGHVSCFSLVDAHRKLRVVWGTPARAEDVDLATGGRAPADLLPETFAEGCPEASPDGRSVLFVRARDVGTYVRLSSSPSGADSREIVMGTRPLWLPSGEEFAFDLDSRHAAVFSLPTGEMTVIGEGVSGTRQLADKAISASGGLVALQYYDDAANSRIVVESLRTLEIESTFVMPSPAMRLDFSRRDQQLRFTLYGFDRRAELVEADWRAGTSRWMGRFPDADILGVLEAGEREGDRASREREPERGTDRLVLVTRKVAVDAWLDAEGGPQRLTHDGLSDGGALSMRGDLLVQRFLGDGGYSIVLRRADGGETPLTHGSFDLSPAFFPDSDRWVYASYRDQQIVECRLSTGTCARLHADASTPGWPTIDAAGQRLAYVTVLNAPRLRILDLGTHVQRDLGPVVNDCAPVWAEGDRLWAMRSKDSARAWAELDGASGAWTGRTEAAVPPPGQLCQLPARLRAASARIGRRVFSSSDERAEVLVRPARLP
jgi:hypothetical protein